MKNLFKSKLIKKICFFIFFIYVTVVFINQQQTLNSYDSQKQYDSQNYNETLVATKSNLDSKEYIEAISREKLDMYSSNERVYININK